jgi:hypothetical protein
MSRLHVNLSGVGYVLPTAKGIILTWSNINLWSKMHFLACDIFPFLKKKVGRVRVVFV